MNWWFSQRTTALCRLWWAIRVRITFKNSFFYRYNLYARSYIQYEGGANIELIINEYKSDTGDQPGAFCGKSSSISLTFSCMKSILYYMHVGSLIFVSAMFTLIILLSTWCDSEKCSYAYSGKFILLLIWLYLLFLAIYSTIIYLMIHQIQKRNLEISNQSTSDRYMEVLLSSYAEDESIIDNLWHLLYVAGKSAVIGFLLILYTSVSVIVKQ